MKDVFNFIDICPKHPIQVLNLHGIFYEFMCVLQMVFLTEKKSTLVLRSYCKGRKYSSNKANIGNPKVNSGCPQLTANRA